MTVELRCLVLGAAGRDFHDFLVFLRDRPELRVVGFTAAQIPFIGDRTFPAVLAGPRYGGGLPIYPEERLPELVRELDVDVCVLAYSDLSHAEVMHKAAIVQAAGAAFAILGPKQTMLRAKVPVVAVTAVRTGSGKSPLSLAIARHVRETGRRLAVLRHPMPYGDLARQAVQRFATAADLDAAACTIEEREEYQPYLDAGLVVFAGVDYRTIVARAEQDFDAILWDGGNNDLPFVRPDLWIAIADALRPGHELAYHPGETNIRAADVVVVNKVGGARPEDVAAIVSRIETVNPRAAIVRADLEVSVADPALVKGRRVLVVEDGPTLTHGGMAFGAGFVAAERAGAAETIDPRPFAVGTIAEALAAFPHLGKVLPALGYSDAQREDLAKTIDAAGADLVLDASPARIDRLLAIETPVVRVEYAFRQVDGPPIFDRVDAALAPPHNG